jgi:RimJ/RimL family protein N-acetyltransferase
MNLEFRTLKKSDMYDVLRWRATCPEALRTPFQLTEEQQEDFYKNVICNRNANARFWGIEIEDVMEDGCDLYQLVGMIGLENIEWTNRLAEISIILDPNCRGKKYGQQAIDMLLDKGFNQMNLENIYGEVYLSNPAVSFWEKIIKQYNGTKSIMPNRKYWLGRYYDSIYFNFNKKDYLETKNER